MKTEIRAIVRFKDNIIGIPIEEYTIDCSDNVRKFYYKNLDNPVRIPNIFEEKISPNDLIEIHNKASKERNIIVKIIILKEEYKINWIQASDILETFCSWITFLTLTPVEIIQWLDESSAQDTIVRIGKAFFVQGDKKTKDSAVFTSQFIPPRNFILNDWILSTIPENIIYPLKCYRKALITNRIEEKIINLVSAMEGISNQMDLEKFKVENCPHCGKGIQRSTIVSKDGILEFLKNELFFSRSKIYDPIWKIRSKFIHSDIQNLQCSYEQLVIVEQAAEALFVSLMSYYLLKYTDIPFIDKEQILKSKYEFFHPFFGQIIKFKDNLDALKNIKIR